jgi:chemotaxis family two-component system sensor kinase Cph1
MSDFITRPDPTELRQRAEELAMREPLPGVLDSQRLVHELQVHQLELEMQNEELRRVQMELEESRDRYVDLYEFAPVGYLTLSRDGLIVEINLTGASLLGVDRSKLMTRRFASFVVPEDRDRWHRHFLHALNHPDRLECDLDFLRDDDRTFPGHLDCRFMVRGESPCLRIAFADVTERKLAEDELRASKEALQQSNARLTISNQDLEQFAYVASHDLQEPLRMVVSYGQLLEKRFHDKLDDDAHAFIGFMVEGGHRMQAMVTDLLEFSRVGRMGGEAVLFDSGKAVAESLSSLSVAITEAGAKVICESLPPIVYDRHQFTRLMQNLIGNAVKYRDPQRPSTVTVAARREGGHWLFSVIDNGIGIDSAYFEQVFGVFRRIHTRDKYEGTGIGLAVCKKIVERHGGRIWLESRPGVGSTFFFTILDP